MKEFRCLLLGEEQRPWTCRAVLRSPRGRCVCEGASERVCARVADSAPLLPLTKEVMDQDWFTGRKCTLPSPKYITAVALATYPRPDLKKKKKKQNKFPHFFLKATGLLAMVFPPSQDLLQPFVLSRRGCGCGVVGATSSGTPS